MAWSRRWLKDAVRTRIRFECSLVRPHPMEPLGSDPKRPFDQAQLAHDHSQRGKGGVEAYQP